MHDSGICLHTVSKTHQDICNCSCRCFCYTYYEISSSENLKRNLTYLLASNLFNSEIKYLIVGKVFKDINTFYKSFWFNPKVENETKFEAFAVFKGNNWSYSNWSEDSPYHEDNLQSP